MDDDDQNDGAVVRERNDCAGLCQVVVLSIETLYVQSREDM